MGETTGNNRNQAEPPGAAATAPELKAWFVREVLPLEAALMQFLRRSWRNPADLDDLCQEVYARACEAAREKLPVPAKPFLFAIARNLIIDNVRHENVVSIEAVADPDLLSTSLEAPSQERSVMAREELHLLQAVIDRLPERCRQAVVMQKVDGLTRREIAARMGISEKTVKRHLEDGMCALADALYGAAGNPRQQK
jgi:RNA polymerase sigma-70 factor (ECF subfamily)